MSGDELPSLPPAVAGAAGARTGHAKSLFVVNRQTRNLPDELLLEDLVRVAKLLKTAKLSRRMYDGQGRFCADTFCNRFGSWRAAVEKAGLSPRSYRKISEGELVADIQRVRKLLNVERLSASAYVPYGKFSKVIVYRLFGTWEAAATAAGVKASLHRPHSSAELLDDLAQLWERLGRQPKYDEIGFPRTKFSVAVFERRFGSFEKALLALARYKNGTEAVVSAGRSGVRVHKTPRTVNWRLRYQILSRDRFRCCACGRSPANDAGVKLHVDHIVPWSRGGETTMENLQTLCERCNGGKSDD
jgi:hypothetical protein